jgi:hypothetical protein
MAGEPEAGSSPTAARLAAQEAYLGQRERELVQRLPRMAAEEMRWTVRLLADCLPAPGRARLLAGYTEALGPEALRQFLAPFIPAYTREALADLRAPRRGGPLALTAEELQSLSCAEKWALLDEAAAPLAGEGLARELARLACCRSYELFHDTGLARGAIEYAGYFAIQALLARLEPATLEPLRRDVLAILRPMGNAGPEEADRLLRQARERIARAIGLGRPLDEAFGVPMEPFDLDGFWGRGEPEALLAPRARAGAPPQVPQPSPAPVRPDGAEEPAPAPVRAEGWGRGAGRRWEYRDRMVVFEETREGLVSNLDWMNQWGGQGWELVGAVPLIAPNKDGVAYGTVGALLLFKRPL